MSGSVGGVEVAGRLSILPRTIILKVLHCLSEQQRRQVRMTCKYLHFLVNSIASVKQTKSFYSVEFSQATMIDTPGHPPFRNTLLNICTSATCTNISALLFFVDVSSFDQTTKDNWSVSLVNSLKESLTYFHQLLEIIPFSSRILLYFTKCDLLKKKIEQGGNLFVCPLFSEGERVPIGYEESLEYIIDTFKSLISPSRSTQVVKVVMDEVKDEEALSLISSPANLDIFTLKLGDPSSFYNGWLSFAKYLSASNENLVLHLPFF